MQIEAVTPYIEGGYGLRTKDGELELFDIVIGADGAWSKVRAALTDAIPFYTGITFVELELKDVDRFHPEAAKLVGHGTMFSFSNGTGIVGQRNGNAMLRIYAAFRTWPEETDRPNKTLANITKEQLISRFSGWAPKLLSLISNADRIIAVRPIVALPVGLNWRRRDGLTLIGDAAHAMPPLGVGVNLAMLDAAELAEAIVQTLDWRVAVRAYEDRMLERAARISKECIESFAEMFSRQDSATGEV